MTPPATEITVRPEPVEGLLFFFASLEISSQSPRMSANFFALDQPFIRFSAAFASSRVANSCDQTSSTGCQSFVKPANRQAL